MKFYRIFALIERDMRKFFRNPALMMASMIFPLVQLVVLGYAFGGKITNVQVALVDKDTGTQALDVRQGLNAIVENPKTFRLVEYGELPDAMIDLRAGFLKAVIYVPPDYSQRVLNNENPRIAFIEDNTDTFTASGLGERIQQLQSSLNGPVLPRLQPGESPASNMATLFSPDRLPATIQIQTIEVYPYIEYIKYLLAGSISLSIFVTAMIGGGITFIDDKARGLHEGYLSTPLTRVDLVLGLIGSGAIKGLMAGLIITVIGGLIAGIAHLWEPGAAVLSAPRSDRNVAGHAQLHVSAHGARQRSSGSARHFWRAQYAAVFPFGRHLSHRGFSHLAEVDFHSRSIHVRRGGTQEPAAKRHGL